MANNRNARGSQAGKTQDMTSLVQKINELRIAVEQYKAENPGVDVEAMLSEQKELLPILGLLPNRELDKFIAYAKEQGTSMSFDAMEMGILAAGRKDMQNGLADLANSLKFEKSDCPECDAKMIDRGRFKKKF